MKRYQVQSCPRQGTALYLVPLEVPVTLNG